MSYSPASHRRRWFLTAAACAAFATAFTGVFTGAATAGPSSSPAPPPLHGEWVCVGDSITEGQLASKPEFGYVGRLAAMAAAAGGDLKIVNEGRSGWSTGAYAANAAKLADKLPADTTLVTILLGTNDLRDKGTPDRIAASAAANLEKLVKAYRAKAPAATVVLIAPTAVYPAKLIRRLRDAGYDETAPAKLAALHDAVRALATRLGTPFIDLSALPAAADSADGVHPDDHGHAALAKSIWREAYPVLTATPPRQAAHPG